MATTTRLGISESDIRALCTKWRIRELALFGSAVRDDFGPDSDFDFLVTFDEDATWTLFDFVSLKLELEELLGRRVDLVERPALESSDARNRKEEILATAVPIYGSR